MTFFEISKAAEVPLGVPMPQDRRLKSLCQTFLANPKQQLQLSKLVQRPGLSLSTASRLFRQELGMKFGQWRQQALLAKALAAHKAPIGMIADELGYATPSAFSAMVPRTLGMSPRDFLCPRETKR